MTSMTLELFFVVVYSPAGILYKLGVAWGSKPDLRGQGLQEMGEGLSQREDG